MGTPFGKYELIRKLATGGMAEIWLARQTGMQGFEKPVVIKRILSHLGSDQTFVKMFFDEARMAASLNHPNIVQIYDLGGVEGQYYIAMEYVDGVDVSTVLKSGRARRMPLQFAHTLRIISQACEGLHHAHFMSDMNGEPLNIVHRDVSPQNILISYNGTVKITDFGIARARGRTTKTTTGTLKGKFGYMSFEQISGKGMDHRSDVFSLGVVLWEMLTYRRLFKRENEAETIKAILLDDIPSPRKFWEGLPVEVEAITMKALERQPDSRYQTARDLASDLERFLASKGLAVMPADIAQFLHGLFPEKDLKAREHKSISHISAAAYESHSNSSSLPSAASGVLKKAEAAAAAAQTALAAVSPAESAPDVGSTVLITEEEAAEEALEAAEEEAAREQVDGGIIIEMGEDEKGPAAPETEAPMPPPASGDFEDATPVAKRRSAMLWAVPLALVILGAGGYAAYTQFFEDKGQRATVAGTQTGASGAANPQALVAAPAKQTEPAQRQGVETVKQAAATENAAVKEPQHKEIGKATREPVAPKTEKQPGRGGAPAKAAEEAKPAEPAKPAEAAKPAPAEAAPAPPPPVGDGLLSLECEPWAEVWSGGSKIGDTPLIKLKVPAGRVALVLKNPEMGFEKRVTVAISPNELASQSITIKKGVLNVSTDIPADVYINKSKVGSTPINAYEIFEGSYKMRLVNKEKGIEKVVPITIAPGQAKNVSESLAK